MKAFERPEDYKNMSLSKVLNDDIFRFKCSMCFH